MKAVTLKISNTVLYNQSIRIEKETKQQPKGAKLRINEGSSIILEYATLGSLHSYVKQKRPKPETVIE